METFYCTCLAREEFDENGRGCFNGADENDCTRVKRAGLEFEMCGWGLMGWDGGQVAGGDVS